MLLCRPLKTLEYDPTWQVSRRGCFRGARRLKKEAGVLLDCNVYTDDLTDCKDCRTVANAYNVLAQYIIEG
jgi:hypothetical protein